MKGLRLTLVIMAAFLIGFWLSGMASAFHSGGVAHCDGCHSMHNSQDGAPNTASGTFGDTGNSYLMKGSDPSSTCLNCHANIYRVLSDGDSSAPYTYTPGGDFWWITQDTPQSRGRTSLAESHGHNVIAVDFGLLQDGTLTSGPSDGTVSYDAGWLGCNSCHDPHGKKDNNANPLPIAASGSYGDSTPLGTVLGNFRLLGGVGYDGGEQATGISFADGDPVAVSYHGTSGQWLAETNDNHTDYGSGMSEWCANCHSGLTADGSAAHRHPASDDAHLNGFATAYNSYVATGDMTGVQATAFDRLVPFERGVLDPDNDGSPEAGLDSVSTNGPDANSNVMCLTCHRAHAGPWSDALRWDPDEELLADSPALAEAYGTHVYYGDTITARYNQYQRSLCNKCHLQD